MMVIFGRSAGARLSHVGLLAWRKVRFFVDAPQGGLAERTVLRPRARPARTSVARAGQRVVDAPQNDGGMGAR